MEFIKATRKQKKLRLALIGPSGSGKTYTALAIASGLGGRVAVFDTENGSASLYSDTFDFDTPQNPPTDFSPDRYIAFLRACESGSIGVAVLDSLSAGWAGKGGVLEIVDNASKRYKGNSFAAWKDAAPEQNRLVQEIINCKVHVIATMRTKTEWVIEEDERGKKQPRKVGLAPVQRADLDYEFDVVGDLDHNNNLVIDKTRCSLLQGKTFTKAGKDLAGILKAWLDGGAPSEAPKSELEEKLAASLVKAQTDHCVAIELRLRAAGSYDERVKIGDEAKRAFNDKKITGAQLTQLATISRELNKSMRGPADAAHGV